MLRRWIIRSFFLGLLLLCLGIWAWGTTRSWHIFHHRGLRSYGIGTGWGRVGFAIPHFTYPQTGWTWGTIGQDQSHFWPPPDPYNPSFLGFSIGRHPDVAGGGLRGSVPLWFPTLLLAAILLFVWRKTRPPINPAIAFPLERRRKSPSISPPASPAS